MKEKELLIPVKERLGITELNDMQRKMLETINLKQDIILLSPTGSGKTLAFLLPVLKIMKPLDGKVQCVVIAPSRELVIQIFNVLKEISGQFRVVPLYGGHKVEDEVNSLKITPDIIVATPGRLLDHSQRHNTELLPVRILVFDEFDKSLELGFEEEMKKLIQRMKNVNRYILTSATRGDSLPEFLDLKNPITIDFLERNTELSQRLSVHKVKITEKDKLESLLQLLKAVSSDKPSEKFIIFVNHRESAERIYDFLKRRGVDCVLYHGALDQRERETAVVLFNNGSRKVLVSTDLASRGLDIENVGSVVHYHQPLTRETFVHRNGRTARIDSTGDAYVLIGPEEEVKEYVEADKEYIIKSESEGNLTTDCETLFLNAGKREKISKGDILGFLIKEGGLNSQEIGKINLFDHYSLVSVCNLSEAKIKDLLKQISSKKIKGEKRKFSVLK